MDTMWPLRLTDALHFEPEISMTGHRVAILQSSYIPWKGYFDIIRSVDTFIFYDDVQFTRQDWRTRNRIKTSNGLVWLSIPAGTRIDRLICEVALPSSEWQKKHWASISQSYAKAPWFKAYREFFEDIYIGHKWTSLSEFNQHVVTSISRDILGLTTEFRDSREFSASGTKQVRLLNLLTAVGATEYISGPSARSYIEPDAFAERSIQLTYQDYSSYPVYPQLHGPFEHNVSVLDLIFNTGPNAGDYIWGYRSTVHEEGSSQTDQGQA